MHRCAADAVAPVRADGFAGGRWTEPRNRCGKHGPDSLSWDENKKRTCRKEQMGYIPHTVNLSLSVAPAGRLVSEGFDLMSQSNLRLVEGTSVDKTKALDAALSQIERAFGKGSIMRLG